MQLHDPRNVTSVEHSGGLYHGLPRVKQQDLLPLAGLPCGGAIEVVQFGVRCRTRVRYAVQLCDGAAGRADAVQSGPRRVLQPRLHRK